MKKSEVLNLEIDSDVIERAEFILEKLGVPMSVAIEIYLRQIIFQRGIPFEVKLPADETLVYDNLTKEQLDEEILKGIEDINQGKVFTAEEVESEVVVDYFKKD